MTSAEVVRLSTWKEKDDLREVEGLSIVVVDEQRVFGDWSSCRWPPALPDVPG